KTARVVTTIVSSVNELTLLESFFVKVAPRCRGSGGVGQICFNPLHPTPGDSLIGATRYGVKGGNPLFSILPTIVDSCLKCSMSFDGRRGQNVKLGTVALPRL